MKLVENFRQYWFSNNFCNFSLIIRKTSTRRGTYTLISSLVYERHSIYGIYVEYGLWDLACLYFCWTFSYRLFTNCISLSQIYNKQNIYFQTAYKHLHCVIKNFYSLRKIANAFINSQLYYLVIYYPLFYRFEVQ